MYFSDNFNRSNEALADSDQWSSPRTGFRIVSNEVIIPSTGDNLLPSISCLANIDVDDQEVVLDMTAAELQLFYGPSVRVDSSTGSGYHVTIGKLDASVYGSINYIDSLGSLTVLAVDYILGAGSSTWNQGETHTVKLRVTGTTIELLVDNVVQLTATDTQLTSGSPGLNAYYTNSDSTAIASATIDDFSADYAPMGTEIHLVTVGRHGFSSITQTPNPIRAGEDEAGEDDGTTEIEADEFYTSGGDVYPNHGIRYTPRGLTGSPPITTIGIAQRLPPQYIYQGTSGFTSTTDPQMSYMVIEIYPEGYDNRSTADWEITSISASVAFPTTPTGYVFTTQIESDHAVMAIANTKWPTVPFPATYRCVMEDFTKANFDSVEEAQAATDPEVLSLYKLDLGDPIIDHIEARIDVDVVFTNSVNSSTVNRTYTLRQNVYNETSDYISKVQALNPPGDTVEQNVLPNQFGTKTYTGFQKGFTVLSATNTQTSPPTKVGVAYGASFGQSGGNFYFPLVDDIGDIRNGSTEPEDYPRFSVFTGKYKYDGIIRGLFQFQYADGSNILKLVVDGSTILASSGREIIQDDLVGLSIVSAQSANIQYDYSSTDATFVSDSGGVTLSWEWTLPSDLVLLSTGELNINIATLLGD